MIVYLDGVDGSGKTTLADALHEHLDVLKTLKGITKVVRDGEGLVSTHPDSPKRIVRAEDLYKKLDVMANDTETMYIMDRGPMSDIIYRTFDTYGSVTSFKDFVVWRNEFRSNAKQYKHTPLLIIFCDGENAEQNMINRGDDSEVARNRHREIRYLYKQMMPLVHDLRYDIDWVMDNNTEEEPIPKSILMGITAAI